MEKVSDRKVGLQNNVQLGDIYQPDPSITKRLGPNYIQIYRQTMALPSTFFLCGILARHAAGMLYAPRLWRDVSYDPGSFQARSIRRVDDNMGHTGIEIFKRITRTLTPGGETSVQINDAEELSWYFDNLALDEGMVVLVLCHFANYGVFTHVFAAKRLEDRSKVLLVGDWSPFNIEEPANVVTLTALARSMRAVLDFRIDLDRRRDSFHHVYQQSGHLQGNQFRYNAGILGFKL
jgi:hypothetical protein